jgi:hypothetical protein
MLFFVLTITAVFYMARWLYETFISGPLNVIEHEWTVGQVDPSVHLRKTRILLALIMSAVMTYKATTRKMIVLLLALLWVLTEYALWWVSYSAILEKLRTSRYSGPPHIAYLVNASWFDIAVLIVSLACLLWALKVFRVDVIRNKVSGSSA